MNRRYPSEYSRVAVLLSIPWENDHDGGLIGSPCSSVRAGSQPGRAARGPRTPARSGPARVSRGHPAQGDVAGADVLQHPDTDTGHDVSEGDTPPVPDGGDLGQDTDARTSTSHTASGARGSSHSASWRRTAGSIPASSVGAASSAANASTWRRCAVSAATSPWAWSSRGPPIGVSRATRARAAASFRCDVQEMRGSGAVPNVRQRPPAVVQVLDGGAFRRRAAPGRAPRPAGPDLDPGAGLLRLPQPRRDRRRLGVPGDVQVLRQARAERAASWTPRTG
jgi:hypothetical protein